ncbi:hypothetical protein BX616_002885, partial [Lobosporangium transversale]
EEKRVKELLGNARRRAQRRRAYYDSKLGDPMQLLRVSGTAVQLVTNPEIYTFNEDMKNLMPWASDPSVKIDRFDGRALLDFIPTATQAMIESGLKPDKDEDGIGNELRFQRWHDLVDKIRLGVSEEQCIRNNEEEWNDLVARHHALIGKVSEKKQESNETPAATSSFAFDYGTGASTGAGTGTSAGTDAAVQNDNDIGKLADRELTTLEEENILDHLDELTARERNTLDALGAEYHIQDYYRLLRVAKQEEDARVLQLKVTAVNLERVLAGKKPLKASEIEAMSNVGGQDKSNNSSNRSRRRRRRDRSMSPSYRTYRRSSPSYEPFRRSPSRSDSESPKSENVEFIMEFEGGKSEGGGDSPGYGMDLESTSSYRSRLTPSKETGTANRSRLGTLGVNSSTSGASVSIAPTKMSLAEKLKQRMRQGLDQSIRSNEIKRQAKEREQELSQARQKGEGVIADQDGILLPHSLDYSRHDHSIDQSNSLSKSENKSRSRSRSRSSGRDMNKSKDRSRSRSRGRKRSPSPPGKDNDRATTHQRSRQNRSRSRQRSNRDKSRSRDRKQRRGRSRSYSRERNGRSQYKRRRSVKRSSQKAIKKFHARTDPLPLSISLSLTNECKIQIQIQIQTEI